MDYWPNWKDVPFAHLIVLGLSTDIDYVPLNMHIGPILLTQFNLNPSMDM